MMAGRWTHLTTLGISAPDKIVRADGVHRILDGTATVLARRGTWDQRALFLDGLRRADVDAALRRQNAKDVSQTESVSLEPGGAVVATLLAGPQPATADDVERLEAKLDVLLGRLGRPGSTGPGRGGDR